MSWEFTPECLPLPPPLPPLPRRRQSRITRLVRVTRAVKARREASLSRGGHLRAGQLLELQSRLLDEIQNILKSVIESIKR